MKRLVMCFVAGCLFGTAGFAWTRESLSADQIIAREVAARGGADAWRAIRTMAWTGHIESGPGGISKTPFMMAFRRPDATRFEVLTQGQRSIRAFDGNNGWKLRPAGEGLPDLKDYTAEEISFAHDAAGLDGPLMDYKAKGVTVTLLGIDSVEGHAAYHLKLKLPSGHSHDAWVDVQSFLELRYDRPNRNAAGQTGVVSVYYRNYRTVNGLVLPLLIETGVGASPYTDKMIIEKVAFNPTLDPGQFAKPFVPHRGHNGVIVNTESPAMPPAKR